MPGMKQKFQVNAIPRTDNREGIKAKGFSLIELTLVLGIVGVLSIGSLLVYSEQNTHAQWQESQQKLKVAKKAILKFAEVNKYMPCPDTTGAGADSRTVAKGKIPAIPATPATPAVPKTATAPTIPAIPSTGAQPAIPNIDVSTCTTNSGTIPYDAIGLSRADVQDSWGNLFLYAVDQGVTVADEMLRCPAATACFFNGDPKPVLPSGKILPGSVLPAFNLSTEPLKGALGAYNLRICADGACGTVQSEGLVAVLIATNENGKVTSGLDNSEAENRDGDTDFVNAVYSEAPYYDDLVLGIAANEIKTRHEDESVEVVNTSSSSGPTKLTGNDLQNMGDGTLGGSGTNYGNDDVIWDENSQTFDFGQGAAGKEVVVTFDSHASGTWDQPDSPSSSTTSDSAFVNANSEELVDFRYDFTDNSQDGYEEETFTVLRDRWYEGYNADGSTYREYIEVSDGTHTTYTDYWDQNHEYIVNLDENGQVSLDFGVGTTANYELIDFTNIELIYYDTPADIPDLPSVSPIVGVPESEDLE